MKRAVFGMGLCLGLIGSAAQADPIAGPLCDAALKGDDPVIAPNEIGYAALGDVSLGLLDRNHDGTISRDEIRTALLEPLEVACPSTDKACDAKARSALVAARGRLRGFASDAGSVFTLVWAGTPRAADQWPAALLEGGAKAVCIVAKPTGPTPGGGAAPAAKAPPNRLPLIGKDIASLTTARPKGSSAKVTPASLGLSGDRVAGSRTLSIDAVAGVNLSTIKAVQLIPFIQLSRSEVRDSNGATTLTGQEAAGAVIGIRLGDRGMFNFAPLYSRSLKTRSEQLGVHLAFRPSLLYDLPGFQSAMDIGDTGIAIWTDLQVQGVFGKVESAGSDSKLVRGDGYLRLGPVAAVHITALPDGNGHHRMSYDLTYKRLFRINGDPRAAYDLNASISYYLDKDQHYSLTYGYEVGRDEQTLTPVDKWNVGLGLRF